MLTDIVRDVQAGSQCSPLRVEVYITFVRVNERGDRPTAAGLKPRPTVEERGSTVRGHQAGSQCDAKLVL